MIKKIFQQQDMTTGTPWKKILAFSIPLLIGNIAQQLYSTVDSIVVGQYIGDNALKAIGSSGPIVRLIMIFFVTIGTGCTIMVSQYVGARDRKNLSKSIGTSITWTVILATALLFIGLAVTEPLLRLTRTPSSYFEWSATYLRILFIGVHGIALYNVFAGVLRGLGDSISSLVFVLIAAAINTGLDLYLVRGLGMGIGGAAIATIVSQYISAILTLIRLHKYEQFDLNINKLKPDKKTSRDLFMLGIPSGVMQGIFALSMFFVQSLTNMIDIADINTMVMRVDGFAMLPNFSFGIAMSTYAGQNIGAGKKERLQSGKKQGLILALSFSIILTSLILIFGKNIMGLFTNTDAKIELAYSMMQVLAFGYVAMAVTQVLSGIMRGAGDTTTPMWITIFNNVIVRVPLAYVFAHFTKNAQWPHGKPVSTFGSLLVTWVLGATITTIFFRRGRWRDKALVKSPLADEWAAQES